MIFWFLLVELWYLALVTVQSKESFSVFIKKTKRYQRRGQKGLFWIFLDPSSPRLASGSPGPWNSFMPKQPARLGELIPSGLSISSPGRASPVPKWLFHINSHAGGWGLRVQKLGKEREREEEEEEGTKVKSRHYRIATVIIPYIVLLFCVPRAIVD